MADAKKTEGTQKADWPAEGFLERYRPWRRRVEIGYWVVVLGIDAVFNSVVSWLDLRRVGSPAAPWEPVVWEVSSVLVVGLLIPAIVAFERRFPLRWATLPRHLGWHLAASAAFCVLHVGAMVALRHAAYLALGQHYTYDWGIGLAYEYLKDIRSYALILAALLSYRLLLLRLQGEARLLDAPEAPAGAPPAPGSPAASPPARPERFLVRKLRKEFLVAASDIEWLQAQGNYVGLHVNGHDYLLRATLSDFLAQLDPAKFARVHRSHAVNRDRIAQIEPLEAGDARLLMKDGSWVPCSRRYREGLANSL